MCVCEGGGGGSKGGGRGERGGQCVSLAEDGSSIKYDVAMFGTV